jgi:hypothetical protein
MPTTATASKITAKQLPQPNSDFYHFAETLSGDERAILQRVRTFMESKVARFFADAEALYSYEGTYQMQNLIVGKAVTGFSAFV